jgi:hypothetical protein
MTGHSCIRRQFKHSKGRNADADNLVICSEPLLRAKQGQNDRTIVNSQNRHVYFSQFGIKGAAIPAQSHHQ